MFFFKQKTAYEMRSSDWSSDVCSSDLLQQGSLERLGGHGEVRVDVRILTATHVDLAAAVAEGRFREDLYHRLRVIELHQPPLRERGGDIALIAAHALRHHAGEA